MQATIKGDQPFELAVLGRTLQVDRTLFDKFCAMDDHYIAADSARSACACAHAIACMRTSVRARERESACVGE